MGRAQDEIRRLGAAIYAIAPGGPRMAKSVAASLKLPYPLLYDPKAEVFARFGFEKRLFVIQQSGTVLVDRSGIVRHARRTANPLASLDLAELREQLAALARAGAPGGEGGARD